MPRKKQPKLPNNGFYYLMLEHIANERKRGRNITMVTAQDEMGPVWKEMNHEARAPYNNQAAKAKQSASGEAVRYTSDGRLVSSIMQEEKRKEAAISHMITDIKETIEGLQIGRDLERRYFHMIHTNYFCQTRDGTYIPAEIAIMRFNLLDGAEAALQENQIPAFHRIFEAGKSIPPGYRYNCISNTEETHQIPFEYDPNDDRYPLANPMPDHKVYQGLLQFLEPFKENGKWPPLYCRVENVPVTKNIMRNLSVLSHTDDVINFRIYDIHYLLFHLRNKCVDYVPERCFPTITSAIEEVDRDVHCYASGISCDFHQKHSKCEEKFHHCSLSHVRRLMYLICDHTCHHIGIDLVPGVHCYVRADTARNTPYASGYTSRGDPFEDFEPNDGEDDGFQVVRRDQKPRGIGRGRGVRISDQ